MVLGSWGWGVTRYDEGMLLPLDFDFLRAFGRVIVGWSSLLSSLVRDPFQVGRVSIAIEVACIFAPAGPSTNQEIFSGYGFYYY